MKTIGFIGGGRITKIFLNAFKNKNLQFKNIVVFDTNTETTSKLSILFPEIEISDLGTTASQEIVFIALHPPVIMETLEKIAENVSDKSTIISLAPKIKISNFSGKLTAVKKFVRLIPNATSFINEGYNPICFSQGFPSEDKKHILELLSVLGNTFEASEQKMEGYAIISAMAPTYFWFQWKKLISLAMEMGFDKDEAQNTICNTMKAALDTMFHSDLSYEEVIDLIPVKPIGENEKDIESIFDQKLKGLYSKLTS